MAPSAKSDFDSTDRLLIAAMLAPPLIWFAHLNVSYVWVPSSCASGDWLKLHLFTVAGILLTAGAGFVSWRFLQHFGRGTTDRGDARLTRRRFVAILGSAFAVAFAVLIVANEIPVIVMERCG